MYGGGLRVMEVLRLHVQDIDFENGYLIVRDGKGGKDRITLIAKSMVTELQSHLLESGTNIRVVQKLLGHADVKTTEIYTHVLQQSLDSVISPLEHIQTELE